MQQHACPSVSQQEIYQVTEREQSAQTAVLDRITESIHGIGTCIHVHIGT